MNIIPKPLKIEEKPGYFQLLPKTRILLDKFNPVFKQTAELFTAQLRIVTGFDLPVIPGTSPDPCDIVLAISSTNLGDEGYKLNSNTRYLKITAETEKGIFYGLQSMMQLLPVEANSKQQVNFEWKIPVCKIEDKPRFSWRGMHLDVSRHFFGTDFIKRYIDLLAMHKLNVFHWHLTDDNGWRIEIKKYPELTKTCAWRKDLEHLPWNERDHSDDPGKGIYGGFYTQEQIKDIVQYATDRFIAIVPEIEMPGHTREVFAAYPQFSCTGEELTVASGGYWPNLDIFCAGKDETFSFIKDILSEIIELFPSEYIHIGGDEANKTRWKECPLCQQRIKDKNLKDEKELQSWFIKQIADFLTSKNRKLIGWDEIIDGGLIDEAAVMCWRGDGIDAAKLAVGKGCDAVMCPNPFLYFDWKQNEDDKGAFGVTTLEKVYNYEPVPEGFSQEKAKLILGAQGNVWTEWMPTEEQIEYMTLPRLSALAELVWTSKENKSYKDFTKRLDKLINIFSLKRIHFNAEYK
jgi:hexosaminidase